MMKRLISYLVQQLRWDDYATRCENAAERVEAAVKRLDVIEQTFSERFWRTGILLNEAISSAKTIDWTPLRVIVEDMRKNADTLMRSVGGLQTVNNTLSVKIQRAISSNMYDLLRAVDEATELRREELIAFQEEADHWRAEVKTLLDSKATEK